MSKPNPDARNDSISRILKNPPNEQPYLIPRIAKEKLKPIESELKIGRSKILTTHLNTETKALNS